MNCYILEKFFGIVDCAFAILSGAKRLHQRSEIKNPHFAALSLRDALRCVQDAKNPLNGRFKKEKG